MSISVDLVHGEYPDSQSESLNSDQMKEWAENHEMGCYYPKPNELLIDIDDQESYDRFRKSWDIVGGLAERPFDIKEVYYLKSKTGDAIHMHIIANVSRDLTDLERLLLQACFGSDRTRELLSFCRLLQNDPHPIMLVRPKGDPLLA